MDTHTALSRLAVGILVAVQLCLLVLADTTNNNNNVNTHELYGGEVYTESLEIETLPEGRLLSTFEFHKRLAHDTQNGTSFRLLPKSLGEILTSFDVKELHLTFAKGRWNYETWGIYDVDAQPGAQLAASFLQNGNALTVDEKWKRLAYGLAGLFCASLNFIDSTNTMEPTISLRHLGNDGSGPFRYAALTGEAVCTENLTPWTKLLPCNTKRGLASLLNAHRLFDSEFYSMTLVAKRVCFDAKCASFEWDIQQKLTSVGNLRRKPVTGEWSLSTMYDRKVEHICPFSSNTTIKITGEEYYTPKVEPSLVVIEDDRKSMIYKAKTFLNADLGLSYPKDEFTNFDLTPPNECPLRIARQLTGYGGPEGGLLFSIENHGIETINATLSTVIPWFLLPYIHTLKSNVLGNNVKRPTAINKVFYNAPIDRERPAVLEVAITIPAESLITITLDYQKELLGYTEYPPDANRGFDLAASILSIESQSGPDKNLEGRVLYTGAQLIIMPTPDFSMPYNVITLTCTVVALFFGSSVNMLARNFIPITVLHPKSKGTATSKVKK